MPVAHCHSNQPVTSQDTCHKNKAQSKEARKLGVSQVKHFCVLHTTFRQSEEIHESELLKQQSRLLYSKIFAAQMKVQDPAVFCFLCVVPLNFYAPTLCVGILAVLLISKFSADCQKRHATCFVRDTKSSTSEIKFSN